MKKKIFAICLSMILVNGLNASVVSSIVSGVSGSIANSFLSKLDSTFNNLFSSSLSLVNACLGTNWSLSLTQQILALLLAISISKRIFVVV